MRIAYIAAGAGSLRCGACAHDFLLVSRLRQLAHDVHVLPVYTPVHTDLGEFPVSTGVFLGGINAYLRVRKPALAKSLRPLRAVLDSTPVLNLATRRMVETDAHELGDLTQSFLQGVDGPHAAEFARLVDRLKTIAPDAVFLTNSLLSSLAPTIKQALSVPVFCGFMGEDSFIMDLPEPFRTTSIELLRRHAAQLDRVICPSHAGIQQASLLLLLPEEIMQVIPAPVDSTLFTPSTKPKPAITTIGYLSVMRPAKGLDLLLHALQQVGDRDPQPMRLLIAGQVIDRDYYRQMRRFAVRLPSQIQYRFIGEVTLEQKLAMLRACHAVVTPSRIPEARGLAAMEAMACATPVVAPAQGTFPELTRTGGGWLFEPGSVDALARHISSIILSKDRGAEAGQAALAHVREIHDPQEVARQLEKTLLDRATTSGEAAQESR